MKPVVIIAIAVGVSVVAVLGVLIGIGEYQQVPSVNSKMTLDLDLVFSQ